MSYDSPKLGPVVYGPDDVIRFADGIPGFEHLRDFLVVTRDECAPFVFLASLEEPEVAIPLLPLALAAGPSAGEIAAQVAGHALATAGVPTGAGGADVVCYAVVAIGLDAREVVVNLRAPVLVNLDARHGCQVILADENLPVAAPLGA